MIKNAKKFADKVNSGNRTAMQEAIGDIKYAIRDENKIESMIFMGYILMYLKDELHGEFLNYFGH